MQPVHEFAIHVWIALIIHLVKKKSKTENIKTLLTNNIALGSVFLKLAKKSSQWLYELCKNFDCDAITYTHKMQNSSLAAMTSRGETRSNFLMHILFLAVFS